jgi:predicted cation transporter
MDHLYLLVLLSLVLFLPFFVRKVEEQMEYFLFAAGALAATMASCWSPGLIYTAAVIPIKISAAVLVCGTIFEIFAGRIGLMVGRISGRTGKPFFIFLTVIILGLFSSVITAIVAALILSEIISHINLPRDREIKIVVISCFAVGIGAVLTPLGEPLSTIVTGKLSGAPFNAGFMFLFRQFWAYSLSIIVLLAITAAFFTASGKGSAERLKEDKREGFKSVAVRAFKVYVFVAGLVLLGAGFTPAMKTLVPGLSSYMLYWINMVSAVLDNATLAAAEISPALTLLQLKSAMLGLIISGGMLIPGNIPNIICAGKLRIKAVEWAKIGVPAGLIILSLFFVVIIFINL